MARILVIDPSDNVGVALQDLEVGTVVNWNGQEILISERIRQKHKFSLKTLKLGELVRMYGVTVSRVTAEIQSGGLIQRSNVKHDTSAYLVDSTSWEWTPPQIDRWAGRTWQGYHRSNGEVGTANHWLIVPLVFCENRNIEVLKETLVDQLGYAVHRDHKWNIEPLIQAYLEGASDVEIRGFTLEDHLSTQESRIFPNVDGIKFLKHDMGCGGTREDATTLCNLLAGYITHPNVAGATVLSLGCQNAQIQDLQVAIEQRSPGFDRPVYYFEQQASESERSFLADIVRTTFTGLMQANQYQRSPAGIDRLVLGLECGGSDGFSGISANPALGHCSDLIAALGGRTILAEFPELNGVEQELINRCRDKVSAEKFASLMQAYSDRAVAVGSGFESNPSPGNIRDGLITDAIKSAGAAKKGGTSPVVDVLDYTEPAIQAGLNLLCTPGGDVESTTGLAGSGANVIVFTTGLGTPTGNVISPLLKMATNSELASRMSDIIDISAGAIISGEESVEEVGERLLDLILATASGEFVPAAVRLGQDDFIPWKRGISL